MLRGHSTERLLQCSPLNFAQLGSSAQLGVRKSSDLSTAHCMFAYTQKEGNAPPPIPKPSYTLGRAETQLPAQLQASWNQPGLSLILKVMENRQEGISCLRSVSFRCLLSIQYYTCAVKIRL